MPVMSCMMDGMPGFKYGESGHCYTYTKGNEKAMGRAKRKALLQGVAMGGGKLKEDATENVSDAPWESVDKSKLPKSAFLWIEGEGKTQWHLPYKDEKGSVNLGALRAISAAVAGARTGKPMDIPPDVKSKITALLKKYKIGEFAQSEKKSEPEEIDNFIKECLSTPNRNFVIYEGGAESGFRGHAGRPGMVGGSSSGAG